MKKAILKRLEKYAYKKALDYSNGIIDDKEIKRVEKNIYKKLKNILGYIPKGFFYNLDPRGYALKIHPDGYDVNNYYVDWGNNIILVKNIDKFLKK